MEQKIQEILSKYKATLLDVYRGDLFTYVLEINDAIPAIALWEIEFLIRDALRIVTVVVKDPQPPLSEKILEPVVPTVPTTLL